LPAAGLPRKRGFMARNIVLCLDGTSNQYAATNTNVVKLCAMLDRARLKRARPTIYARP
jgi:uncharacterized protein (DUF2235 family)